MAREKKPVEPEVNDEVKEPEVKTPASDTSNNPKFGKEQILQSNWYSHRRDVLTALLADNKQYSHADVDKLIDEFLKGKVK